MITIEPIDPSALASIAESLGQFIALEQRNIGFYSNEATLTTTLGIWKLDDSNALTLEAAPFTDQWEHIVSFGGGYYGVGRSYAEDDGKCHIVFSFARGEVANSLNGAITWIEANISEDYLLRLLYLPRHHLQVLWLHNQHQDKCYVYYLPYEQTHLRNQQLYTWDDLRAVLRLETPVIGVRLNSLT